MRCSTKCWAVCATGQPNPELGRQDRRSSRAPTVIGARAAFRHSSKRLTPAEIITAAGGALSTTLLALAALIKALRRKRRTVNLRDNRH